MEQLINNPHWFWITLGGVLLAAELLGASGYLLWSGLSAVLVGSLVWLVPFSWQWQWLNFAALTIITALLWWYWLRRHNVRDEPVILNQRNQRLIGKRVTLREGLQDGYGRIHLGDGSWRVEADSDLPAGCEVEVVDVKGITLKIEPVKTTKAVE
ncbi:MAG: NfeD family protein [Enterobacteriaceae bacterium]